eukprot:764792-Hanusia_phi.AAC.3
MPVLTGRRSNDDDLISASAPCLLSNNLNMEEMAHSNASATGQSDDEHSHAETPNSAVVQGEGEQHLLRTVSSLMRCTGHEHGGMPNSSMPRQIPSGAGQVKAIPAPKADNGKCAGHDMEELVGGTDNVSKRLKVLKEALEKFSFYETLAIIAAATHDSDPAIRSRRSLSVTLEKSQVRRGTQCHDRLAGPGHLKQNTRGLRRRRSPGLQRYEPGLAKRNGERVEGRRARRGTEGRRARRGTEGRRKEGN